MNYERSVWGGIRWEKLTEERIKDPKALENYGYKVYSQNDEDGMIQEIFHRIGTTNKKFIEFGVQDGLESNSHYLLHQGWTGLWIEGSKSFCDEINTIFRPVIKSGKLRVINAFITKENIESLFKSGGVSEDPDFLSIDIDGNDWYVWNAISIIHPRVVCIEYNGKFPPDYEWKQAYNKNHVWDGSDWQGASLKAMQILGEKKGYKLVGTDIHGGNAFFVSQELVNEQFMNCFTSEELYNPLRLHLIFLSGHPARYCLVDQEENKGVMNYYDDMSKFKKSRKKANRKNHKLGMILRKVAKRWDDGSNLRGSWKI